MTKKAKIYCAVAIVALLTIFLIAYYHMLSESISNVQKRDQISKLYLNYKVEFPDVREVPPREAMELTSTGKVVFIDVRAPNEQNVSRLPGAITADLFLEKFDKYNDYIKIGYCTIGYRSGIFAQELLQKGIPIYNLRGGLLSWVHAGGKVYNGAGETKRIHVYGEEWNIGPESFEAVW